MPIVMIEKTDSNKDVTKIVWIYWEIYNSLVQTLFEWKEVVYVRRRKEIQSISEYASGIYGAAPDLHDIQDWYI